ncbi:unnamed protein product [Lactuca virosa]|uniref:Uncharacterized protein n=1 Tax=Lactuca virosa TaxID=75947 RepID=A0AAU9MQW8_9ASTR|nr:unnamed protein product [Lactuca virosa]
MSRAYLNDSQTKLMECNFFEWIDDELEDGYYKTLIYSMKQQLDSREDRSELGKYKTKVVELEFLLSKENDEVERLQKLLGQSNKVAARLKLVIVVLVVVVLCLWMLWK